MGQRNFRELLEAKWAEGKFVCVGLDSEYSKIPEHLRRGQARPLVAFNKSIVLATEDLVCAYKPNIAFYEDQGGEGLVALRDTITFIHYVAPDVPVILDAKRADIGNTNNGYAKMAFEYLGVDAITAHPYLGAEALQPFLDCADKGIIILCRTSNPGAGEFQDLPVPNPVVGCDVSVGDDVGVEPAPETIPLYQYVAHRVVTEWNKNGNCALVVGATYPGELRDVRGLVGDMPILIPGVGFQQKDVPLEKQVDQVVSAGRDSRGRGMIINSARAIIFASSGWDYAEAARRETEKLHSLVTLSLARARLNEDV